jgi:glycosyltransferase involved in cell wall biosynthesis
MHKIISEEKVSEKTAPIISVALPVYNGERYLSEAIDSILAQTFVDFELIIIDDGSTDASLDILRDYEKRDARIRLIYRENSGLVMTLNEIIDLARGIWIARMDQDDIAMPQRFEKQMQWLEQTGVDICGSWVQFFGVSGQRILKHPCSDAAIKMNLLFGSPLAHPTVFMKTELIKNLRYDPVWDKAEDYDLWERADRDGWKMTNIPEVLLLYRQHDAQISTATSIKQKELTQKIRFRRWLFVFESLNLNKVWIDEVLKLRESPAIKSNMDDVDSAFTALLQQSHAEARETVLDHMTRLYFRAAADCPDIAIRWYKLNRIFGTKLALSTVLKLWLLSLLKFNPNGKAFSFLKHIYFRTR